MPYKSESIIIAHTKHDRRIKLTDEQRKEIPEKYLSGISQRKLAKMYSVSRRLISFIINPSVYEENLKRREERGGTKFYYDKKKHREYIKDHRRYKQKLKITGEI
ncbi:MAG TPA: hypothetical protein DCY00_07465 [Actinobacteria bacterium]|nr:hypothetical protein [Actinomycetota bacterium]